MSPERIFHFSKKSLRLIDTTKRFVIREIKTRYAGSLLGSLWIIAYPLIFALIAFFVFSYAFHGSAEGVPYFLFVLAGFNSWFWFSQTVTFSTRSLVGNRDLIVNNKFPTEALIFSVSATKIIDYAVNLLVFFALLLIFRQEVSVQSLLFVGVIAGSQLVFQTGISLLFAAANVFFRDFQNIVDIALQLVFYATPVIYSLQILPLQLQKIALFNPMTQFVIAYREAVFSQNLSWTAVTSLYVMAVPAFLIGYFFYKRMERKFAEWI